MEREDHYSYTVVPIRCIWEVHFSSSQGIKNHPFGKLCHSKRLGKMRVKLPVLTNFNIQTKLSFSFSVSIITLMYINVCWMNY